MAGPLVVARRLDDGQLAAVAALEAACTDDGRLKLEWATLRARPGDEVRDLLFMEEGELLGFLGLYRFGFGPLEMTGMVHPRARRRGIGGSLLRAALDQPLTRTAPEILLVADRRSAGGTAFSLAVGGTHHHSEHLMTLTSPDLPPAAAAGAAGGGGGGMTMRPAGPGDEPFVGRMHRDAFGGPEVAGAPEPPPATDLQWTRILEAEGEPVGVIRAEIDAGAGYIAGFVVEAARRGQGIGRAGLRLAVAELVGAGAWPVSLEVATDNDHALGLYLDTGFDVVSTMDYFSLPRT